MSFPKINNRKLRKELKELGLIEDKEGYWYYPPFSTECDTWLIAAYETYVRIVKGFNCDVKGIYREILNENDLDVYKDHDEILNVAKELLKKYDKILYKHKKFIMNKRINDIKGDFK